MKHRTKARIYYYLIYLGVAVAYTGIITPENWFTAYERWALVLVGVGLSAFSAFTGKKHKRLYGQTRLHDYTEEG